MDTKSCPSRIPKYVGSKKTADNSQNCKLTPRSSASSLNRAPTYIKVSDNRGDAREVENFEIEYRMSQKQIEIVRYEPQIKKNGMELILQELRAQVTSAGKALNPEPEKFTVQDEKIQQLIEEIVSDWWDVSNQINDYVKSKELVKGYFSKADELNNLIECVRSATNVRLLSIQQRVVDVLEYDKLEKMSLESEVKLKTEEIERLMRKIKLLEAEGANHMRACMASEKDKQQKIIQVKKVPSQGKPVTSGKLVKRNSSGRLNSGKGEISARSTDPPQSTIGYSARTGRRIAEKPRSYREVAVQVVEEGVLKFDADEAQKYIKQLKKKIIDLEKTVKRLSKSQKNFKSEWLEESAKLESKKYDWFQILSDVIKEKQKECEKLTNIAEQFKVHFQNCDLKKGSKISESKDVQKNE